MELKKEVEILLDSYYRWLKDSTRINEENGAITLTTPHLDRHNDCLEISVTRAENGYVLSDDGYILSDLEACGCPINSARRVAILQETLNGFGVQLDNGELMVSASSDEFPMKKHSLLQAMLAVNDIFYLATPRTRSLFHHDVKRWLGKQQVRIVPDSHFKGRSGYTHKLDFVVPSFGRAPERMLKTINKPDKQATLNFIGVWQDLRPQRKSAKPYALLNDANEGECQRAMEALGEFGVAAIPWSERNRFLKDLTL